MHAELNGEQGMIMSVISMVLMVVINAWHLYMLLVIHRPAGAVIEAFQMPDLKHYKDHYSKEEKAEFRRRDRDQKREQQRRVTRWAEKDSHYHETVAEHGLLAPGDDWVCPGSWCHLAEEVELEHGFVQPTREFSLKVYL